MLGARSVYSIWISLLEAKQAEMLCRTLQSYSLRVWKRFITSLNICGLHQRKGSAQTAVFVLEPLSEVVFATWARLVAWSCSGNHNGWIHLQRVAAAQVGNES